MGPPLETVDPPLETVGPPLETGGPPLETGSPPLPVQVNYMIIRLKNVQGSAQHVTSVSARPMT